MIKERNLSTIESIGMQTKSPADNYLPIHKKQRTLKNKTQQELAEDICSAKYIFLIEIEERNPSAYILNQLSERFGIDLFEYYQYLEFENPVAVIEHRKNIDQYIQAEDLEKLKRYSKELLSFQKEYNKFNQIYYS